MGKAIIFSAPSGSGKTTIVHELIKRCLPIGFSISATNRKPRPNEKDGVDYFFLDEETFKQKVEDNQFVEWEEVYQGTCYGTLKSETERIWNENKIAAFDVDVKGGVRLKNIFGNNAVSVFIKAPSLQELEYRLRERKTETEEAISKRLERAAFEISFENKFDYIVVNDDLCNAVEEVSKILVEFIKK